MDGRAAGRRRIAAEHAVSLSGRRPEIGGFFRPAHGRVCDALVREISGAGRNGEPCALRCVALLVRGLR